MIEPKTLEKLKAIPERQWGDIYKRLVLYAKNKLKFSGFERRSEDDSVDPEDFVSNAIEKIFDGARAWDFERFPDIEIHLKGVVKSLISNHLKSSGRKPLIRQRFEAAELVNSNENEQHVQDIHAEENDDLKITEAHWAFIEKQFIDDDDGLIIFYDWLDSIPPREIAAKYSMAVTDVYNVLKKGKRVITSLSKVFNNV